MSTDSYYNASNAIRNLCAEHSKVFGEEVFNKVFTYYEKVLTKYFRMSSIFKNLFEANEHLRDLIVKDIENLLNKEYNGVFDIRSEGYYIHVLKYGTAYELEIDKVSNQYGKLSIETISDEFNANDISTYGLISILSAMRQSKY